jgi:hypothetical protein
MKKYFITENDYIVQHVVGIEVPVGLNQKIYNQESITGSSVMNSKYDSATDSFIPPTSIRTIIAPDFASSEFPMTYSFSDNIISENIDGAIYVENGNIASSSIDGNQIKLLINLSEDISEEEDMNIVKVTIDKANLTYDGNGRINHPHKVESEIKYFLPVVE